MKIKSFMLTHLPKRWRRGFGILGLTCTLICNYGYSHAEFSNIQQKKTLRSQLNELQEHFGVQLLYQSNLVGDVFVNVVDFSQIDINTALDQLLKANGFSYKKDNQIISISPTREGKSSKIHQVNKKIEMVKIEGVVKDEVGEPLPGVSVIIKGTTLGCATDIDGKYTLSFPKMGGEVFVYSFVGMDNKEVKFEEGTKTINVTLLPSASALDEVVVTTGYFVRKKDSYTGTATTYSGDELRTISSQNMLTTLSMMDPSFKLTPNLEMGSDPNSLPKFTIRGGGSLESEYANDPNQPIFILDGFEVSAQKVFDLDPNRVASMTLLKDAAATAIYGSRSSNGVVVIETKTPKFGELQVNYTFTGDFSFADLTDYDLMNSAEKLAYEKAAGLFKHPNVEYQDELMDIYNQRLSYVQKGIDTDWLSKPVEGFAFSNKHFLMFEGGDSQMRYGLSVNYNDINGVMKESGRNQIGIEGILQYRTGKFKFSNNMSYNVVNEKNSPYGSFAEYGKMNPYYDPYDENGNPKKILSNTDNAEHKSSADQLILSPLHNVDLGTSDKAEFVEFNNNFAVEWDPTKELKIKGQLSINKSRRSEDLFLPSDHTNFYSEKKKGSYQKAELDQFTYDANVVTSYNKLIENHMISLNGVWNVREEKSDLYKVMGVNYPNDNMDHIGMGTEYPEGQRPYGNYELSRLMGVALNANYGYDNRYLIDFSIRSDASSMFGANKRWGTFGSLGAAWNIHNEKFTKENSFVNELKIRASIGTTGGQNFSPFQALNMFSYKDPEIANITYDDLLGALAMAYGNDDLEWQVTKKKSIGIDFKLANSRISGYLNYYQDISESVLIDVLLAPSTGFDKYKENLGKVENKGIEANLKLSLIQGQRGLRWDVFGSVIKNNNRLMELNDALIAFNDVQDDKQDDAGAIGNRPPVRYQEGMSINTIWANRSLGIDSYTGEEVFLTPEGERVNTWSTENYMPLGCTDPDFEGNFGTLFTYEGFQLNTYFRYSVGGDIYNQTLVDKVENVDPLHNADRRVLYDRWSTPGIPAKFKAITNTTSTMHTSRFIEEENYVEMTSLSLAYRFPTHFLQKIGFDQLKLTAIGNNVFRASSVKMERGTEYPFARTYSLSAQLSF